jgi:segregation and condensation protein B
MIMRNTMDNGPASGWESDQLAMAVAEAEAETGGEAGEAAEAGVWAPELRMSLEAVLLVADEPVSEEILADVTERPAAQVAGALRSLAESYTAEQRGFDLREVAGGWRLYTRDECAAVVERFVSDGQEIRLTQAALETLAVVAYRQPVSRARVSAVRGVNCDGVMRTLVLRGLVEEAGSDPETGAFLFQTTGYFLERLGLARLSDLPDLAPFLPDQLDDELDAGHDAAR